MIRAGVVCIAMSLFNASSMAAESQKVCTDQMSSRECFELGVSVVEDALGKFEASRTDFQQQLKSANDRIDTLTKQLDSLKQGVIAFRMLSCPPGWDPYHPAEGKFIRGLTAGRSLESAEEDAFQGHTFGDGQSHFLKYHIVMHSTAAVNGYSDLFDTGVYGSNTEYIARGGNTPLQSAVIMSDGRFGSPRIADETRPKNISLLYCVKS